MREWQPSEGEAFGALRAELASPEGAAAVAAAEATALLDGAGRTFEPIYRDYAYES